MTWLRDQSSSWGQPPPNPWDLSHSRQNDGARRQIARPPLIPAAESALGLRPRSALSSAQVFPEWTTATSPCNDLSANGDYPLNFVSHARGSVQFPSACDFLPFLCPHIHASCLRNGKSDVQGHEWVGRRELPHDFRRGPLGCTLPQHQRRRRVPVKKRKRRNVFKPA